MGVLFFVFFVGGVYLLNEGCYLSAREHQSRLGCCDEWLAYAETKPERFIWLVQILVQLSQHCFGSNQERSSLSEIWLDGVCITASKGLTYTLVNKTSPTEREGMFGFAWSWSDSGRPFQTLLFLPSGTSLFQKTRLIKRMASLNFLSSHR